MKEDKLAKELETYRQLAKNDKKIDVASLAISAMLQQESNVLTLKEKRWAYLISIGVPPFGLFFAFKFYCSVKDDGEQAAWICALLTAVSLLSFVLIGKILLSSSGTNVNQITPSLIPQLQQITN